MSDYVLYILPLIAVIGIIILLFYFRAHPPVIQIPYSESTKEESTKEEPKPEPKVVNNAPVWRRKGFVSKGERMCREILEELFDKPFEKIRPDFLRNPETGCNLEIDCYNDELALGVEYSGEEHYVWPNFTGQTHRQFIMQIRRDRFKVDACDQAGVYLITVPYTVPFHEIRDYILGNLPDRLINYRQNKANEQQVHVDQLPALPG